MNSNIEVIYSDDKYEVTKVETISKQDKVTNMFRGTSSDFVGPGILKFKVISYNNSFIIEPTVKTEHSIYDELPYYSIKNKETEAHTIIGVNGITETSAFSYVDEIHLTKFIYMYHKELSIPVYLMQFHNNVNMGNLTDHEKNILLEGKVTNSLVSISNGFYKNKEKINEITKEYIESASKSGKLDTLDDKDLANITHMFSADSSWDKSLLDAIKPYILKSTDPEVIRCYLSVTLNTRDRELEKYIFVDPESTKKYCEHFNINFDQVYSGEKESIEYRLYRSIAMRLPDECLVTEMIDRNDMHYMFMYGIELDYNERIKDYLNSLNPSDTVISKNGKDTKIRISTFIAYLENSDKNIQAKGK